MAVAPEALDAAPTARIERRLIRLDHLPYDASRVECEARLRDCVRASFPTFYWSSANLQPGEDHKGWVDVEFRDETEANATMRLMNNFRIRNTLITAGIPGGPGQSFMVPAPTTGPPPVTPAPDPDPVSTSTYDARPVDNPAPMPTALAYAAPGLAPPALAPTNNSWFASAPWASTPREPYNPPVVPETAPAPLPGLSAAADKDALATARMAALRAVQSVRAASMAAATSTGAAPRSTNPTPPGDIKSDAAALSFAATTPPPLDASASAPSIRKHAVSRPPGIPSTAWWTVVRPVAPTMSRSATTRRTITAPVSRPDPKVKTETYVAATPATRATPSAGSAAHTVAKPQSTAHCAPTKKQVRRTPASPFISPRPGRTPSFAAAPTPATASTSTTSPPVGSHRAPSVAMTRATAQPAAAAPRKHTASPLAHASGELKLPKTSTSTPLGAALSTDLQTPTAETATSASPRMQTPSLQVTAPERTGTPALPPLRASSRQPLAAPTPATSAPTPKPRLFLPSLRPGAEATSSSAGSLDARI
ncbi:hypothetical protein GE09DRAFT_1216005 [Coniochaeta sp. 2T2.1]|nr:hypothetical protein GE09DRAFT_1216005 [Coniochaeta sp. 2T2.1]